MPRVRWRGKRRRVVLVAAGGWAVCLASTPAAAVEWYLDSEAGQYVSYETNIGLNDGGSDTAGNSEGEVSGLQLTSSLAATAGVRTPVLSLSLTSLLNFTVFPDNRELNSNDQYLTLAGTRTGQRWSLGLSGQYIRDTTRTSDVEDTGSLILANKRREYYGISPEFIYRLTPVDQLSLTPAYGYNHYDTNELPDSSTLSLAAGWQHDVSPRSRLITGLSALKLNSNDSERGNNNSRSYTLSLGGSHKLAPNLEVSLTAGPSLAQTDTVSTVDGIRRSEGKLTAGYGFLATVAYAVVDRLGIEARLSRALTPSLTTGTLNEDTTAAIGATYRLSPTVSIEAPLFYLHRDQIGGSGDGGATDDFDQARDYASFEPTLRWRIGPDCDLRLGYGLRWQSSDRGNGVGNALFAFLTYRPPSLSMSR